MCCWERGTLNSLKGLEGLLSKWKPVVNAFWEKWLWTWPSHTWSVGFINWNSFLLPLPEAGITSERAGYILWLQNPSIYPWALLVGIFSHLAVIYVISKSRNISVLPGNWKYTKPKEELMFLSGAIHLKVNNILHTTPNVKRREDELKLRGPLTSKKEVSFKNVAKTMSTYCRLAHISLWISA